MDNLKDSSRLEDLEAELDVRVELSPVDALDQRRVQVRQQDVEHARPAQELHHVVQDQVSVANGAHLELLFRLGRPDMEMNELWILPKCLLSLISKEVEIVHSHFLFLSYATAAELFDAVHVRPSAGAECRESIEGVDQSHAEMLRFKLCSRPTSAERDANLEMRALALFKLKVAYST